MNTADSNRVNLIEIRLFADINVYSVEKHKDLIQSVSRRDMRAPSLLTTLC